MLSVFIFLLTSTTCVEASGRRPFKPSRCTITHTYTRFFLKIGSESIDSDDNASDSSENPLLPEKGTCYLPANKPKELLMESTDAVPVFRGTTSPSKRECLTHDSGTETTPVTVEREERSISFSPDSFDMIDLSSPTQNGSFSLLFNTQLTDK